MPLAMSQEHGNNLQTVQMLLKKNQVGICSGPSLSCLLTITFFLDGTQR